MDLPGPGDLDTEGLDVSPQALKELLAVKPEEWLADLPGIRVFYGSFEEFPKALRKKLEWIEQRLNASASSSSGTS